MSARCKECGTPIDEVPLRVCSTHVAYERAERRRTREAFLRLEPLIREAVRRRAREDAYDAFLENCDASTDGIY